MATAAHKMRPAITTEMLAYHVSSTNIVPFDANDPGRMPQEQEGFIDATGFPDGVPSRGSKRLEPGAEERVPRPRRRGGRGLSWPSYSSTQPMPGLRDDIDDDHRVDSADDIMDRGGAVKTKNGLLYHPVKSRRNNTGDVAVPAHAGGLARSRRNNIGDVAVPDMPGYRLPY